MQSEGKGEKQYKKLKENFWVAVSLTILFGVSWVFGMLATAGLPNYIRIPFDIIFSVLASLQGLFVFLLYCLRSPECRRLWMDWLHCRFTQASRTTTSIQSTKKSSMLSTSSTNTPSSRMKKFSGRLLAATLNRSILSQSSGQNENLYTLTNHSISEIGVADQDEPYVEKITFEDNFSETSVYFGMQESTERDKDGTVLVNEEAVTEL